MVGLENSILSSCKIVAFLRRNSRGSVSPSVVGGVGVANTRRFTPNASRSRVTSLVISWPAPKPQRRPAAVWTVDRSQASSRLSGPMRSRRESAIATGRQASAYPRCSEPQSTIVRSWVVVVLRLEAFLLRPLAWSAGSSSMVHKDLQLPAHPSFPQLSHPVRRPAEASLDL